MTDGRHGLDWARGHTFSAERNAKISAALKGRAFSDLTRERMSASQKRRFADSVKSKRLKTRLALWAEQDGRCAVCGDDLVSPEVANLDHDHRCCRVGCPKCWRSLLCAPCNRALGHYEQRRERIDAYLEAWSGGRIVPLKGIIEMSSILIDVDPNAP